MQHLRQLIAKAKQILPLREDTGSEGLNYLLKYTGELKEEGFKVLESYEENGVKCAKIMFDYPKDCGFAALALRELGINVKALELLF